MKRSSLKRTTPLKAAGPAKSAVRIVKCKAPGCQERFAKLSMDHRACSQPCAIAIIQADKARKEAKAAREDKKQTRAQREALKTLPQLKREAQAAFNAFIRARDRKAGHPCICCGQPLDWSTAGVTGSRVDAGHYRSTGSADHLRFNEANCHAQRVHCNRHGAGRAVDYRIGLIARIGLAAVEALEADNATRKWTRDEVRSIRDTYRRRAREIGKGAV